MAAQILRDSLRFKGAKSIAINTTHKNMSVTFGSSDKTLNATKTDITIATVNAYPTYIAPV